MINQRLDELDGSPYLTKSYLQMKEPQKHLYEGLVIQSWDLWARVWEAKHARVWHATG